MQLVDKIAIVTGGARGIGAGIARCLASEGAKVALVDVDGTEAEALAASIGAGAIGIAADVSRESEIATAASRCVERFGGLDIFVNNAGGGRPDRMTDGIGNPFTRISEEGWDEQLATNLRTTFAGSKAAIPHLKRRGGGSIVNIASIAGLMPMVATPAYGAAKAGVVSLTRSLALELAEDRIRVNAICPGLLWTRAWEMLATMMKMGVPQYADLEPRQIFLDRVKRSVPLGEEQTPEDVGRLAAFLCSDGARNITGQSISVDGGVTLRGPG
ncbi:MAG: SDR family NAD(P)-dependent oxidoreductase [Candidatus Binatia bacterium]